MDADLLTGLLLAAVVLTGAGYLVHVLFGHRIAPLLAKQRDMLTERRAMLAERRAQPPPGANDHLIGAFGRVVDDGERSGKMRVRVGMERWGARLGPAGEGTLPVGTEVEITAVDGRVLEVRQKPVD